MCFDHRPVVLGVESRVLGKILTDFFSLRRRTCDFSFQNHASYGEDGWIAVRVPDEHRNRIVSGFGVLRKGLSEVYGTCPSVGIDHQVADCHRIPSSEK